MNPWVAYVCISSALAGVPPELAKISEKTKSIRTLQVKMTQTKELSVFGEAQTSTGTLLFSRPRKLKMDLTGPGGTTVLIDGDSMTMHYKALKKTETVKLSRDPRARAVAEHLFLLLEADPVALSAAYSVEVKGDSPVTLKLVPIAEGLRKVLPQVDVVFDALGFVADLTLHESGGDTTRWQFKDPKINGVVKGFALP